MTRLRRLPYAAALGAMLCHCCSAANHKVDKAGARQVEARELSRLSTAQEWTPEQRDYLERTKRKLIGQADARPKHILDGDESAPCFWDCYRRCTMLEPLVNDIIKNNIPGDFLEAGVFHGGISVFMAAMLHTLGVLGEGLGKRRMWVVDSFNGLPPESYTSNFASSGIGKKSGHSKQSIVKMVGRYKYGKMNGTLGEVQDNLRYAGLDDLMAVSSSAGDSQGRQGGVRFLKGYFAETLPGPVGELSLIRADSDLFASVHETLDTLYPKLSVGGYVVFDDWKLVQARAAILAYRQQHNITSPLWGSDKNLEPPFHSLDRMAFWKKTAELG